MVADLVKLNMGEVAERFTSRILPTPYGPPREARRSAALRRARKAAVLTKSPGEASRLRFTESRFPNGFAMDGKPWSS